MIRKAPQGLSRDFAALLGWSVGELASGERGKQCRVAEATAVTAFSLIHGFRQCGAMLATRKDRLINKKEPCLGS